MNAVYVLDINGEPLMPTTRCAHVRMLLKTGKARVVERKPFTIQLAYETTAHTQPLTLGIDPGRTNIGLAVTNEKGDALYLANVKTRNKEIPKLMAKRKQFRQQSRQHRRDKRRRRARAPGNVKADRFERRLPGCEKDIVLHDIKNKEAKFNHRKRPEGWLTPTANHLLETHINLVTNVLKLLPVTDIVLENNYNFANFQGRYY